MDDQSYSRLLSFVVCELTMPVKKHLYNSVVSDQSSMNHHLLTAAGKVAKSNRSRKSKSQKVTLKRLPPKHTDSALQCNTSKPEHNGVENFNDRESSDGEIVSKEETLMERPMTEFEEFGNEIYADELFSEGSEDDFYKDLDEGQLKEIDLNKQLHTNEDITSGKSETEETTVVDHGDIYVEVGLKEQVFENSEEYLNDARSYDKMSGFYSDPLLLCSDADFKTMFRMTRSTFKNLLMFLSEEEMEPIEDVPLYKKLLIVLWLMGNSGSYSDAAQVFNVTEEAAANCLFDVSATLYNKCDNVIKWPSPGECAEIASRVEKNYGFPGVVGVLGCFYFSISIPKEALSRREHFNAQHRTYCIALQIVCDDRLVIRDVFPGLPGGTPEAQVLRESPLCEQLTSKTEPHLLVEPHKHVLARSEYPQLTSMLTPYSKQSAILSKDEIDINNLHESVCRLVDQTFQMLQDRFLTLKLLDPEVATMMLVAACVLHNICMENNDRFETSE